MCLVFCVFAEHVFSNEHNGQHNGEKMSLDDIEDDRHEERREREIVREIIEERDEAGHPQPLSATNRRGRLCLGGLT